MIKLIIRDGRMEGSLSVKILEAYQDTLSKKRKLFNATCISFAGYKDGDSLMVESTLLLAYHLRIGGTCCIKNS
jgi:hypothetical protein